MGDGTGSGDSAKQDMSWRIVEAEKVRSAIYRISEAAHRAENLQSLFKFIHEIIGELMPAENLYIALCDPAGEEISFPYFVDALEETPPPRKLGNGLTEYVLRLGEPLHGTREELEEMAARGEFEHIGPCSVEWLGVPLRIKDRPIGVLVVQSYTEGVRYGEDALKILAFVSEQVAMAIERKRNEEALRASEERFSRAFNSSPYPTSIHALNGMKFVAVNDRLVRNSGYAREELIGRTPAEVGMLIAESDGARIRELLSQHGRFRDIEVRMRAKGGDIHDLLLSGEVIEVGGEQCAILTANDITERKRAEEDRTRLLRLERAARNEAEHLNRLRAELLAIEQAAREEAEAARREWQITFDTMTDGVLLVDCEDRLIRANRAMYAMMGLTPEVCAGRPLYQLLHERGHWPVDTEACPICSLRRKREHGMIELPAGIISSFPIVAIIDPIVDSSGKTVGVIQVVRDQTELVRAREEAERGRVSLNAAIEQMGEAMIVFDEKARVIRANWHAQRIFGFTPEELASASIVPLIEGRFSDEEGRVLSLKEMPVQTSLRERRIVDARLWYTRPDGRRILLSHNSSPFFNSQNELAGAIALARDITEQHREDERVQQADKLRALGQLASGVAHNFNNALAAVIGYTQLALPKIKDPDIEKYLKVVEKSAKDAARMVERIQNFSRGRSQTDDFFVVRLSDIVRDAVDITRPRWRDDAEALGLKYDVRLDCKEDLRVSGQPSELREVFVNIILNALDAMSVGGSLSITVSSDGPNAILTFTDTGCGMTEEIKRRIFEPFFTTKGVSGLGMGLSESYRIIERHGGRIDVESQLKRGTTFTILLPLAEQAKSTEQPAPDYYKVASARVLVIDDEEFVRGLLATVLAEQGNEVVEAASAEEAFDILGQREFDVVFTDLAMPKTDGIAAAAEIKSRWPRTRVVLMSGYGAEKAIELAGDGDSIDAAISKPFNMAEVVAVVKRVLNKR